MGNFDPLIEALSAVLILTLSKYLESHKRLVVPQLGAFLVKEPGVCVVFSELLRRDDGVLRGLLRSEGLGELEAAGEIDRFVFEVRHAVEHGRSYDLDGFGVLKPGPNATILFEYRPAAASAAAARHEAAGTERRSDPDPHPQSPETAGSTEPPQTPGRAPIRTDRVAEAVETAFSDPHVSPSVKMNPEPYVRGLKYGKPHKTTDAYRYVDRAPRRRRFDRFLLLAIIAAGIAVAAIAFGYWRDLREKEAEAAAMTGQTLGAHYLHGGEQAARNAAAPAPHSAERPAAAPARQASPASDAPAASAGPLPETQTTAPQRLSANPNPTDK